MTKRHVDHMPLRRIQTAKCLHSLGSSIPRSTVLPSRFRPLFGACQRVALWVSYFLRSASGIVNLATDSMLLFENGGGLGQSVRQLAGRIASFRPNLRAGCSGSVTAQSRYRLVRTIQKHGVVHPSARLLNPSQAGNGPNHPPSLPLSNSKHEAL